MNQINKILHVRFMNNFASGVNSLREHLLQIVEKTAKITEIITRKTFVPHGSLAIKQKCISVVASGISSKKPSERGIPVMNINSA